jgi:hypothetical protein
MKNIFKISKRFSRFYSVKSTKIFTVNKKCVVDLNIRFISMFSENNKMCYSQESSVLYKHWFNEQHEMMKLSLERIFVQNEYDENENVHIIYCLLDIFTKDYDNLVYQKMRQFIRENIHKDFPCKPTIILAIRKALIEICLTGNLKRFKEVFDIYPVFDPINGYGYLLPYIALSGNVDLFKHVSQLHPISFEELSQIQPKLIQFEKEDLRKYNMKHDMKFSMFAFCRFKYLDRTSLYNKKYYEKCDAGQTWNLAFLFACSENKLDIIRCMAGYNSFSPLQLMTGLEIAKRLSYSELEQYLTTSLNNCRR